MRELEGLLCCVLSWIRRNSSPKRRYGFSLAYKFACLRIGEPNERWWVHGSLAENLGPARSV